LKALDRLLQRWRVSVARPYVEPGDRVLDVGCADGALFRILGDRIVGGVGIDAEAAPVKTPTFELVRGTFPEAPPAGEPFDVITLLAVLEHVPPDRQAALAAACAAHLKPLGRLVVTTPEPAVDRILDVLKLLHLIDGMSLEEHYGFEPARTPGIFVPQGLKLVRARAFQLGLNHLFVFRKEA
jgi:2-polyprenyl-3-methyl-5-hydroxy-6-metoxy-1,4-benzoquinol methylase